MITFAIPTWNRASHLDRCVHSIAKQIVECKVGEIVISDNASDDETREVIKELKKEFPFVTSVRRDKHGDFQDNFKDCFSLPQTRWTWTFGDDDVLLPGALKSVLNLLETVDVEFLHVAELSRAMEKQSGHRGTLMQLCCKLGWLDMTGFISCNIVKTERLKHAVNLPSWGEYSKNAFPQSCALLEELRDAPALFADIACVDTQKKEFTKEDDQRWTKNQIARRFFYVDEAIQSMVDRGILKLPIPAYFFRYISYYLWDRLITNMISDYCSFPDRPHKELWANIDHLVTFLQEDDRRALEERIVQVKSSIDSHFQALNEISKWSTVMNVLTEGHNVERFGYKYLGEPTERPVSPPPPEAAGISGLVNVIWHAQKRQRDRDLSTVGHLSNFPHCKEFAELCRTTIEKSPLCDFQTQGAP